MTKKHRRQVEWEQEHQLDLIEESREQIEHYAVNKHVDNGMSRFFVVAELQQMKDNLKQAYFSGGITSKEYKHQVVRLRWQIFIHYVKNVFFFPIWIVKILSPSFFKGTPNIWTNLKIIATTKEFHPLRMAMISWFVFSYLIIQGGIFLFKYAPKTEAATYYWVQNRWLTLSADNATHDLNQTDWTRYSDLSPTDLVTTPITGEDVYLKTVAATISDTDTADFEQGTVSDVTATANALILARQPAVTTSDIAQHDNGFCGLRESGVVFCWGRNPNGELGNGTIGSFSASPVQVVGTSGVSTVLSNIEYIGGGGNNVCAIDSDQFLYCWGDNSNGELGNNLGPTDSSIPVRVVGVGGIGYLSGITQVGTGSNYACALNSSGNVFCWGEGGKLGNNGWSSIATPVQVLGVGGAGTTLNNIIQIQVGYNHSCALNSSGNVFCWGSGSNGKLGNADTQQKLIPVRVVNVGGTGTLGNISYICKGWDHSGAIDADGYMYMWGENSNGQMGNNNAPNDATSPVRVLGVGGVDYLANLVDCGGGFIHSNAVNESGEVFSWGYNAYGQLGNNQYGVDSHTPSQVSGVDGNDTLTNIRRIESTWVTSCSLDNDKSIFCWGEGTQGERGDGLSSDLGYPSQTVGVGGTNTLSLGADYLASGTYTSQVIDTLGTTVFGAINWTQTLPSGTSLDIKVRTWQQADMSDATPWASCSAMPASGFDISANDCVTDGHRYVQYQAAFTTTNQSATPELRDITINYTQYTLVEQALTSSVFDTGDSANIIPKISWSENLPAGTDIKFQIRTSPDNSTWTEWLGPNSVSDYYTAPAGTELINVNHRDALADQYMQYKVFISTTSGTVTPTLSDVTVTYVVNVAPEFSNDGVVVVQNPDGTVSIIFATRDTDASTDTNGLVTPSFEYSLNDGATWTTIVSQLDESGFASATTPRGLDENNWATSVVTWTPKNEIDGQIVSQARIRVTVDDGEAANNIVRSTSDAFPLDVKDPELDTPSFKVVATTTPATIYNNATDDNSIQMIHSLNANLSGASWEPYTPTKILSLSTDPETVYAQFRDAFSNTVSIQSATTPNTPDNMVIRDLSNVNAGEYGSFIAWNVVDVPDAGFGRYDIWRSTDGGLNYTLLNTQVTMSTNYYFDQNLTGNATYFYKVSTVDADGNTSPFSTIVSDNADGQGGTDVTTPTITNVSVSAITTQGFTVTWDTDEVSSSSVAYAANAFSGSFTTSTSGTMVDSATGLVGSAHSMTITGLTPETVYYFHVASADPSGNRSYDNNDGTGYDVTTLSGPSISNVTVDSVDNSQAVITWQTNNVSDSTVYYATNAALLGAANSTNDSLVNNHSVTLTGLTQGTIYYFYVTSANALDNNSGNYYSFTTSNDSDGPVIASQSASNITDTGALITWNTNEGGTSQVAYGTTTGELNISSQLSTTYNQNHSVSLSNLVANTTYYYTVTSVDISGNETTSIESSFTTRYTLVEDTPDIAIPTISSVSVAPISDTTAVINWITNEATTSRISYGTSSGALTSQTTLNSYLNTSHAELVNGLTANTTYYYTVTSADDSGNSAVSTEGSFTTLNTLTEFSPDITLPVISSVAAAPVADTTALINWTTDEITNARVSYGTAPGVLTTQTTINSYLNTSHAELLSGLLPNTRYYYTVTSVDVADNSITSAENSFTTLYTLAESTPDTTNPTITLSAVAPIADTTVVINWTTNEAATSIISYGIVSGALTSQTTLNSYLNTSHSELVNGLAANTRYYYTVTSADAAGNSFTSVEGSFSTLNTLSEVVADSTPPNISAVSVTPIADTTAVINWTTDEIANSIVSYGTTSGALTSQTTLDSNLNTSHAQLISGLTPNTRYYFTVSSVDISTNSRTSIESNFITLNTLTETVTDVTAPTITSVSAAPVSDTTAIINWITNEAATSMVAYGTSSGVLTSQTVLNAYFNSSHAELLSGLNPNTRYYYRATSVDSSSNSATSDESSFVTLETLSQESAVLAREAAARAVGQASATASAPQPAASGGGGFAYFPPTDKISPSISDVKVIDITAEEATITWNTDEAGDTAVEYGKTQNYDTASVDFDALSLAHSITLFNLKPDTEYNFRAYTSDKSGNRTKSQNQTFTTLPDVLDLVKPDELPTPLESEQPENVFKYLINKTAELIRKMSGQISVDALESGLTTQFQTVSDLGKLVPLPIIGGQPVAEVGASYARIYWTTDKESNSLVAFAQDSTFQHNKEYTQVVGNASETVTSHEVLISELKPSTTYHFQVRSKTPVSDTAKSRDFVFTTKEDQVEISTYKIVNLSPESTSFTWVTNVPTDSKVTYIPYDKDGKLLIGESKFLQDKTDTTIHSVTIKDLEAGQIYQIEISGKDVTGATVSKTISTFSTSDVDLPPVILQVQTDAALLPGDQTAVQAIISWATNEGATSQVFYQKGFAKTDEKKEFAKKTPLDPNYVKRHIMVITDFEPGAVYQFQVESVDSSGNITRSRTFTLLSPRQKESVFQIIMSNIEDTFGWVGQLGI